MYFGSVRFYKNLIFVLVCVLIAIPTVYALKCRSEVIAARESAVETQLIADDDESHGSPDTLFEPDAVLPEDASEQGVESTAQVEEPSEPSEEMPSGEEPAPVADPPSYQLLFEDFYAPEPYSANVRRENTVYLTFDDGPSDRTDEILDVLAEKNVKATFFVIGQSDSANLERMKRIVAEGHTIGMHSFSHNYSSVYSSVDGFLEEFYRNFCQIRDTTGVTPTVFRCPGGSINGYNGSFYQEILSEMIRRGFVPFDWNVSSEDATTSHVLPAETLINNVVGSSIGKVRSIVLFHDSGAKTTTAQAVGPVIDKLLALGYTFEAISPDTMPVLYNYPKI